MSALDAGSAALTWIIADGYYLYKDRVRVTSNTQEIQVGAPTLPKGKPKHDEFFGDTEVYYEVLKQRCPSREPRTRPANSI